MRRPKPVPIHVPLPHPFIRAMPRLSLAVSVAGAVLNVVGTVLRGLWPWRRVIATGLVLSGGWYSLAQPLGTTYGLVALVLLVAGLMAIPPLRRWSAGWFRCALTRRQLVAGLTEARAVAPSGRLPLLRRVRTTPVGERIHLRLRAGQSAEAIEARVEELRAAVRARDVRVTRDPGQAHRVIVDVVRRDPLAASANVAWTDRGADVLSMWQPVHLGVAETGEAVRLSLVERSLLVGGEPGSGKSSLLNVVVAHAAQSPDAHLLLIDPNEVQFGPWRHRALAYAADDPGDALDVLERVRVEIRRRLALLRTLPGVVRKVTPDIAAAHGLPLWVLVVDELAFHTSVVGSTAQRQAFTTAARDIVARCRAAGIIPLMATQRPTSDVVPTSLRDLFSLRCSFRTTTTTSSDVILGDSWARRGYTATDIDLTARGVGWLLAEGHHPQRVKAAWLDDATIADLAVTTIRHRPAFTRPEVTP